MQVRQFSGLLIDEHQLLIYLPIQPLDDAPQVFVGSRTFEKRYPFGAADLTETSLDISEYLKDTHRSQATCAPFIVENGFPKNLALDLSGMSLPSPLEPSLLEGILPSKKARELLHHVASCTFSQIVCASAGMLRLI